LAIIYSWQIIESYTSCPNLRAIFFNRKKFCINFEKTGLGDMLGDFVKNSSGRPADINYLL
jgi:hypothetical protein